MKTYSEARQGYVGIKVDILILTVGMVTNVQI